MKTYTKYPRLNTYIASSVLPVADEDYNVQIEIADETTDVRLLTRLAQSKYWTVREAVAGNPATPVNILEELAHDCEGVCEAVAANSSTPPEVLSILAKSYYSSVRLAVAMNPHTPIETLYNLANHWDARVATQAHKNIRLRSVNSATATIDNLDDETLEQVCKYSSDMRLLSRLLEQGKLKTNYAWNPNLTPEFLKKIAVLPDDNYPMMVKIGILLAHKTTPEILKLMYENTNDDVLTSDILRDPAAPLELIEDAVNNRSAHVRWSVAKLSKTPEHIMLKLAKDPDNGVRQSVAQNPKATYRVLQQLSSDTKDYIRGLASYRLQKGEYAE